MRAGEPDRELVLVGAGHAHVQVLRRLAMRPLPGLRVTLVSDGDAAWYSGMVPGLVARRYPPEALAIDPRPLARRAGATWIEARVERLDPGAKRLHLADRPPLRYHLASFNVGATVVGADLPGVRSHTLTTRPLGALVAGLEALDAQVARAEAPHAVVIGAGAAGVELAFCLEARWRVAGVRVSLLEAGPEVLPGGARAVRRRVMRALERRGITVLTRSRVASVEPSVVHCEDGRRLSFDAALWAGGAAATPLFARSGVATDADGYALVRDDLSLVDFPEVFAVGDCARLVSAPHTPRAGVYAVRQGPFLDENLRARVAGRPTLRYRPQGGFLTLLDLGDGTGIGGKWGVGFEGAWVGRLKERIDRAFVRRFQVLDDDGAPAPGFEGPRGRPSMDGATPGSPMACGGCAAKVPRDVLARALGALAPSHDPGVTLGLEAPDDAAIVAGPGGAPLVMTTDGFRAFWDDPWLVAQVAAVNAVSDVYAMGAEPRFALAAVGVPDGDPEGAEVALASALDGIRRALDPLGCTLVGGHTTVGAELTIGLTVLGVLPDGAVALTRAGLRPGDAVVLTQAIGTGVVLAADALGEAPSRWVSATLTRMLTPNDDAAQLGRAFGATAMTDVTGFGLVGHLTELAEASGVTLRLAFDAVPLLPGAAALARRGLRSTALERTPWLPQRARVALELAGDPMVDLLLDPQTSGGLAIGLPADRAPALIAALHAAGLSDASVIAVASTPTDTPLEVVRRHGESV